MSMTSDLRVLFHLALSPIRGETHAERLESFYAGQAEDYDAFRKRLLHGREDMLAAAPLQDGAVWIDMGGGTASNLEMVGDRIARLQEVYVVDLSRSLLDRARRRVRDRGWTNVEAIEADATTFEPPTRPVDVVTFSYSLTMIPDWYAAIDRAWELLRPGGTIGVVDFTVARKHADAGSRHSWWTRTFWPTWFAMDNVFLSPDHLPYLRRRFEAVEVEERRAPVPYLPGLRTPYYIFIGRKREST